MNGIIISCIFSILKNKNTYVWKTRSLISRPWLGPSSHGNLRVNRKTKQWRRKKNNSKAIIKVAAQLQIQLASHFFLPLLMVSLSSSIILLSIHYDYLLLLIAALGKNKTNNLLHSQLRLRSSCSNLLREKLHSGFRDMGSM